MIGDLPTWALALLFVAASAAIWMAGTRLEHEADAIAKRTGLGSAFTGVLLLATATSLPEVATTVTAVVFLDDPELAVHNLLGGVALQTGVLVAADALTKRKGALTYFAPRFALLIQGVGLLLLLQIAIGAVTAGGVPAVAGISVWVLPLAAAYGMLLYLTYRQRAHPRWTPSARDDVPQEEAEQEAEEEAEEEKGPPAAERRTDAPDADAGSKATGDERPLRSVWLRFGALSAVVLVAGYTAAHCADGIAQRTGLGSAFVGATLLATATSLPEVSTTAAAARSGRYTMAMSNVFGGNAFDVALLVVADLLYRGGSVFARPGGASVAFVAIIASAMTCIYLVGLLERENKDLLGVGWDSVAAAIVYLGGMAVLYFIQ